MDYSVIPWAIFTDPEVARVGLNEREAKARGVSAEITRFSLSELDRAIADEAAQGVIKVLTVPGKDKILGVTIVGQQASDLIIEFIAAMRHGFGLSKILSTIHIYPTWTEANQVCGGPTCQKNCCLPWPAIRLGGVERGFLLRSKEYALEFHGG